MSSTTPRRDGSGCIIRIVSTRREEGPFDGDIAGGSQAVTGLGEAVARDERVGATRARPPSAQGASRRRSPGTSGIDQAGPGSH